MTGKTPVKSTKSVTAVKMKTSNQYAYIILPVILFLSDYCAVLCAEQLSFTLRNLLIVNHGELRSHSQFQQTYPLYQLEVIIHQNGTGVNSLTNISVHKKYNTHAVARRYAV